MEANVVKTDAPHCISLPSQMT